MASSSVPGDEMETARERDLLSREKMVSPMATGVTS